MKIVFVGDIHARGTNPRNRMGNYMDDLKAKMRQVFDIATSQNAPIICTGDFFDSPNVSISVVNDIIRLLQDYREIPFYSIAGNHDLFGHNIETLDRTPLGLLYTTKMIQHLDNFKDKDVQITGADFDYSIDSGDYHEYMVPEFAGLKIVVVHGMLMPESPPFEMKHSLVEEVTKRSNADVVVTGHYHTPFSYELNGKLIFNPGALMRISASLADIRHKPQVTLLDTESHKIKTIPLDIKPAKEVLDRQKIEAAAQREADMQKFINSLEATGESRFLDIQNIIEAIAAQEDMHPTIVKEALDRVSIAREKKKEEEVP